MLVVGCCRFVVHCFLVAGKKFYSARNEHGFLVVRSDGSATARCRETHCMEELLMSVGTCKKMSRAMWRGVCSVVVLPMAFRPEADS